MSVFILGSVREAENPVVSVHDCDGCVFTAGAGLFAINDIKGQDPKRSIGREIEFGEVFQCVGVWFERGIGYVALTERALLRKRGISSRQFRKIG